ncbi:uncharacterized protein AKAW2_10526A [Aspergillus luchuensis]|uniref:Uncharacterized protein n=1 Tax=Aspergillus kawachii TaxID=1069201 RepID=A0A7R7VZB5_ASPKA|nr:uncharacterized protein AKAW2_10526A [Aspergillus luchuensis]BCR93480.1 hypothetical protein AKAW2_10526A [Aspergillus luchuensis]
MSLECHPVFTNVIDESMYGTDGVASRGDNGEQRTKPKVSTQLLCGRGERVHFQGSLADASRCSRMANSADHFDLDSSTAGALVWMRRCGILVGKKPGSWPTKG